MQRMCCTSMSPRGATFSTCLTSLLKSWPYIKHQICKIPWDYFTWICYRPLLQHLQHLWHEKTTWGVPQTHPTWMDRHVNISSIHYVVPFWYLFTFGKSLLHKPRNIRKTNFWTKTPWGYFAWFCYKPLRSISSIYDTETQLAESLKLINMNGSICDHKVHAVFPTLFRSTIQLIWQETTT